MRKSTNRALAMTIPIAFLALIAAGCGTNGGGEDVLDIDGGDSVQADVDSVQADVNDTSGSDVAGPDIARDADDPDSADFDTADDADVGGADTHDVADLDTNEVSEDPCPDGFTFYDFPCKSERKCETYTGYAWMKSTPCWEIDDPQCCSGAVCDGAVKWVQCPPDTICLGDIEGYSGLSVPCHPLDCGFDGAPGCAIDEFCERIPGNCGGPGHCVSRDGCPDTVDFVTDNDQWNHHSCGCDNRTYRFECHHDYSSRMLAGVNVIHYDECTDCGALGLTQANPEGFTRWLACLDANATFEWFNGDLQDLLEEARMNSYGYEDTCPDGGTSYLGDLDVDVDGHVTADLYAALCRMVTYAGVQSIVGAEPASQP